MRQRAAVVMMLALPAARLAACESSTADATPVVERARVKLQVDGMACEACAARLTKELRAAAGVLRVEVVFEEKLAVVDYEAQRLTQQKLVDLVHELGFEAIVPPD